MCPSCYQQGGSLLHCLSTLTCTKCTGGLFLLHWPGSHLHRTLSGILPYEARTFLTCSLSAFAAAIVCATHYRSILSCRKKNVNTYFPAHRFQSDTFLLPNFIFLYYMNFKIIKVYSLYEIITVKACFVHLLKFFYVFVKPYRTP